MSDETSVLYNADCPVCSAEINHYIRYAERNGLPLIFDDLNACDLTRWGMTADQAAQRLYVLKDGELVSGIPAFLVLWREMPRYRWLAWLVSCRLVQPLAEKTYDHILAPLIYRWHLKRAGNGFVTKKG